MKKLVYIVEDNLVQQKMLQVHFEQLGDYTVRVFTNPDDMFVMVTNKMLFLLKKVVAFIVKFLTELFRILFRAHGGMRN